MLLDGLNFDMVFCECVFFFVRVSIVIGGFFKIVFIERSCWLLLDDFGSN